MNEYHEFNIRIPKLGRVPNWLIPTPGNMIFTVVIILALVWAQSAGAFGLAASTAATTSTGTIAYQGRLADSAGTPLTATYPMVFRLYNAASGGAPLWEEQWTASNSVAVSDGLFNVMLGSITPVPQSILSSNTSLWLGISVGTDSEMTPRVQLGSVPYAYQALTVPDGTITNAKLADGSVSQAKLGADINLTPPDGSITTIKLADASITSEKLNLQNGTACLSSTTQLALSGKWSSNDVPGLVLNFSLNQPSKVLFWMDGLASTNQSSSDESTIILLVDSQWETGVPTFNSQWYALKGQRILDLASGSHIAKLIATSAIATQFTIHGDFAYRTCINYLVLGQ